MKGRNDIMGKPMRDVHIMAAHRRRHHIQRTQGGAALYPGLSHYAPLGRGMVQPVISAFLDAYATLNSPLSSLGNSVSRKVARVRE
jgi:hypothetical protein